MARLFSDFECQAICDRAAGRTPCAPPDVNSRDRGGSPSEDGPGACIQSKASNLDSTGHQIVRKGSKIQYPSGFTGRVSRVRLGHFWVDLGRSSALSFHTCACVRVIG